MVPYRWYHWITRFIEVAAYPLTFSAAYIAWLFQSYGDTFGLDNLIVCCPIAITCWVSYCRWSEYRHLLVCLERADSNAFLTWADRAALMGFYRITAGKRRVFAISMRDVSDGRIEPTYIHIEYLKKYGLKRWTIQPKHLLLVFLPTLRGR